LLLALPLVMPSFIAAFAFIAAFSPGGLMEEVLGTRGVSVSGFWGALAVLSLLTYPYVLLPVAARLRQLPSALDESARLLGKSPLDVFRGVVLPQAAPAILAGCLLVFLYVVGDFGAVVLLRVETLTEGIFSNRLIDPEVSLALSLLLAVVALSAAGGERRLSRSSGRDQIRDASPAIVGLGRWLPAALAGLVALIGLALVVPAAVLVYWASKGLGGQGGGRIIDDPASLAGPAISTSLVSIVAAVVAVAVVLPVAYHMAQRRDRLGGVANAAIVSGFALPGLVVALALVFWALGSEVLVVFYQTIPLLIAAYVLNFGALALGSARVAVAGVPARLDDAARALGSSRLRRFLRIDLPLMTPGLLAGAGLVLLSAMKELPATLLLAPPGFSTLATKIWGAAQEAIWADASLAALVLLAASSVLTWALVLRRGGALG
ncbi:MAG: ABC transporter permease subunit, partial [Thermoleophilia bacterium]|nr:ABC transporter permease subunit [Thermoleophilia bacterium]